MRADDVKPQGGIATDTLSFTSRASVEKPTSAEGSSPVQDTKPENGRAYTGAPKSPEGSGSGFNNLIRLQEAAGTEPAPTTSNAGDFGGTASLSITNAAQTGLNFLGSSGFTFECWHKGTVGINGDTRFFFSKGSQYMLRWIDLAGADVNTMRFSVSNGTTSGTSSLSTSHSGVGSIGFYHEDLSLWSHLAVTAESASGSMIVNWYNNGNWVLTSSAPDVSNIGSGTASFVLGGTTSGTTTFWKGQMRDVRLWSYPRTQGQIIRNMRTISPEGTGLVANWRLDGNTLDSSGNGNHLTGTLGTPVVGTDLPYGSQTGFTERYYVIPDGEGYIVGTADGITGTADQGAWDNLRSVGSKIDTFLGTSSLQARVLRDTGIPPLNARVYTISRTFLPFDTSGLLKPPITSFLFLPSYSNNGGTVETKTVVIVQTTQANSGTLEDTDWANFTNLNSPTEGGVRIGSNFSTYWETNNNFNSFLTYGGTTLLGIRQRRDVDDDRPTSDTTDGFTSLSWEAAHSGTSGTFVGDNRGPHLDVLVRE